MLAHERYFRDLDTTAIRKMYGSDMAGVLAWIDENLTDEAEHELAMRTYRAMVPLNRNDPEAYPVADILRHFMSGSFKRIMLPRRIKTPPCPNVV